MRRRFFIHALFLALFVQTSTAQTQITMSSTNQHPLICDPQSGICAIPQQQDTSIASPESTSVKPIKIVYFTDPICSSCWGIEPQLRKLKLEYGHLVEVEYRMGGLLPDWSYNSGGISKPADVAAHWDEVSLHYDMPIDGDLWLEDPLPSSYPPSIAIKAAELQSAEKAITMMRVLREMLFIHKRNITRWEHIEWAAKQADLDVQRLSVDYQGQARLLFDEDLALAKRWGVRGFPTMFFVDQAGNREIIYGAKPYSSYTQMIQKLLPDVVKREYAKDWKSLFQQWRTLTAKEFSVLAELPRQEAEQFLTELHYSKQLEVYKTKNGSIWMHK